MRAIAAAILLVLALCGTAQAQVFGEMRGGIFAHATDGDTSSSLLSPTRIRDANLEFMFRPLVDAGPFGTLNPHLGATADFNGAESFAYAGATWHVAVPMTPVFVEAGLGGALGSNLLKDKVPDPHDPSTFVTASHGLGCALMVHASASVGFDFSIVDIMLTAERYTPVSNCSTDTPTTNVGARVGFSF